MMSWPRIINIRALEGLSRGLLVANNSMRKHYRRIFSKKITPRTANSINKLKYTLL